ncbi:MAG: DUF2066 domain-containing protein [Pseudomonadota bacterium]
MSALVLVLAALLPGQAAAAFDPYRARIPASVVQADGLNGAFEAALVQVLGKLSGNPDQVAALAQSGQLGTVRPLVKFHGYTEVGTERWLEVAFDQTLANDRLRDLRLPVWPLERPETLVWVALEQGGRRTLLGQGQGLTDGETEGDSENSALEAMTLTAELRGVPLIRPLLDLSDQASVRVADVWGGFADNLESSRQRYNADQLLLGRAYPERAGWTIRWLLSGRGAAERWESRAASIEGSLVQGVEMLARRMGQRMAVAPDQITGGALRVRVSGLDNAADYAAVMSYLTGLSVVDRVEPVSVFTRNLELRIVSNAGLAGLEQVLATGRLLDARPGRQSIDLELSLRDR